jgi:hypothetical protein
MAGARNLKALIVYFELMDGKAVGVFHYCTKFQTIWFSLSL